ncbi:hypothetical protein D3C74_457830 [compost metagenome]
MENRGFINNPGGDLHGLGAGYPVYLIAQGFTDEAQRDHCRVLGNLAGNRQT